MSRTALFPGSFDPVTNGHLDLVRQAIRLADRLVLAIGTHPGKSPLFSTQERLAMIEETCAPLARAGGSEFACITFADLVVTAAQREGADYIGFGPIFATPTKPDYRPIGVWDISRVYAEVSVPIFCIGGITVDNLQSVIDAGAKRVVMVSALLNAHSIVDYARCATDMLA